MKNESLQNKLLACFMHLFSMVFTFFLPLIVYFIARKRSEYFAFHAKEGLNLHFTFLPIFTLLTLLAQKWSHATKISLALIVIETILICIAFLFTLKGKPFNYPVIRYFKS
ncbi:hypothetical protein BAMA_05570 [Bacillus manliponensis]|uniref:DUF4870 domain-containing protein n=1 Tax=Bacillus manliponensis TaxID=574376 RepID=A0A073JWB4_9BACI|nr:DUF4870 domain-containing protein [Bacillus manliponensis]KEK18487.1 hypothetical protein BAMA_05570 [Bacillus manliponensis]